MFPAKAQRKMLPQRMQRARRENIISRKDADTQKGYEKCSLRSLLNHSPHSGINFSELPFIICENLWWVLFLTGFPFVLLLQKLEYVLRIDAGAKNGKNFSREERRIALCSHRGQDTVLHALSVLCGKIK